MSQLAQNALAVLRAGVEAVIADRYAGDFAPILPKLRALLDSLIVPPTAKVRIYKDAQGDWIAEDACDYCVCSDWYGAMEWAYGHLAMGHDKEKT